MRWQNSRVLLVFGLVLLGTGFGCFMAVKDQGGLDFTLFRLERWGRKTFHLEKPATAEEIREAKLRAKIATDRALAEFPDLRVEARNILPEENGHLRAYEMAKGEGIARLQASGVLESLRKEGSDFDAAVVGKKLEAFEELGRAIIEISELRQRSSTAMPDGYVGNFPSAGLKAMFDYLQLKSRVAASEGDEEDARRYVSLAVNLVEHLRDNETPNLLSEIIVMLMDRGIRDMCFSRILPELGVALDLELWRAILRPPDYSPSRLAIVLKGEWFTFQAEFSSVIFIPRSGDDVPDPEHFCRAYAGLFSEKVGRLRGMDGKELAKSGLVFSRSLSRHLSKESKHYYFLEDMESWVTAFSRASATTALYDAAFDLLIKERNGANLSAITETFVTNPLTELPFDYDPTTRKISEGNLPADWGIEPLTLPKL